MEGEDSKGQYFIAYPASRESEAEVKVLDLLILLFSKKWKIIAVAIMFACTSLLVTYGFDDQYKAEVLLSVQSSQAQSNLAMKSDIANIASFAGISFPKGSQIHQSLAIMESKRFLTNLIHKYGLKKDLFPHDWDVDGNQWKTKHEIIRLFGGGEESNSSEPTDLDAYEKFIKYHYGVSYDEEANLVSVYAVFSDPVLASNVANYVPKEINNYLRLEKQQQAEKNLEYLSNELVGTNVVGMQNVLYQLIEKEIQSSMLADVEHEYAFKVIDPAVIPEKKVGPNRVRATVVGGVCGGILACAWVLLAHYFGRGAKYLDKVDLERRASAG